MPVSVIGNPPAITDGVHLAADPIFEDCARLVSTCTNVLRKAIAEIVTVFEPARGDGLAPL
jgi:hypothetical protein